MSRERVRRWLPAIVLGLGVSLTLGLDAQRALPLRTTLEAAVPKALDGYVGQDIVVSEAEMRVAGATDYLMRVYRPTGASDAAAFSVYVGYYASQTRGSTIHSPKNCLPGAGWEALASRVALVPTPGGPVAVNRYLIQRGDEQALVLYWYQGRGRVESNEYAVKLDLLADAAFRRRSDEALVRILVPLTGSAEDALGLATGVAAEVIDAVDTALPS